MTLLTKVVWSEGMHLAPHHFQVQGRYFEDAIRFAVESLWFAAYGLSGVQWDAEALHNGTVALLSARGLMPDGLAFQVPEADAAPAPRRIADLFPPTREAVTVLLAIPPRRSEGRNCVAEDQDPEGVRFQTEHRPLHDETTGRDERPITLGRKNLRILIDTEDASDLVTLPLARVRRDGTGHFVYDADFVPPCLQISASASLMSLLQRLIEILEDKSAALSVPRGGASSWADYATREIANFWMRHTVNASLPPLRHLWLTKRSHPEELYREMARLGGALCTFANNSHPRSVPAYDHDNLGGCLTALDRHIRAHLELIAPTNCITIPLLPADTCYWQGVVTDQRCLDRCRWILGVRAPAGEAEVIRSVPQLAKLCSREFVPRLVQRALPGMALTHLPVPPAAISARVDMQYFSVSRGGPCWDHIVKTREVGLYVPAEIPQPELELQVVIDS